MQTVNLRGGMVGDGGMLGVGVGPLSMAVGPPTLSVCVGDS